jgi:hypothetical protein
MWTFTLMGRSNIVVCQILEIGDEWNILNVADATLDQDKTMI